MTLDNENSKSKKLPAWRYILPLILVAAVGVGVWSYGDIRALGESRANAIDTAKSASSVAAKTSGEDAWLVRCDEIKDGEKVTGEYCEMTQNISVTGEGADPSTAQRLVEMAIGYPPSEKGKAFAAVILPLGILVNKDVEVSVDGSKALDFEVAYCDVGGCVASFLIDGGDMDALSGGSVMTLSTTTAGGQPVAIEMSLAGFGKARDRIKAAKS